MSVTPHRRLPQEQLRHVSSWGMLIVVGKLREGLGKRVVFLNHIAEAISLIRPGR